MSQNDWENLKDIVFGLFTLFIAWQNSRLGQQNQVLERKIDVHERRATSRARLRGEPLNPVEEEGEALPFPFEETEREP